MKVINSLKSRLVRVPVQNAASLVAGSLMIKGATAETDLGVLIENAVTSAGTYVGILAEMHDINKNGSALVAGAAHSAVIPAATGAAWFAPMGGDPSIFPSRLVELIDNTNLCRIDYDLTGVAAASSNGTTVTIANLEDNIDTAFLYVATAGAGTDAGVAGMLRFVDTSAAGSCTTSVEFGAGDAVGAGLVVKILPLFHTLFRLSVPTATVPTKISPLAAVGVARLTQMERHIIRNGNDEMMDPYTHGNLSGLNSLNQFGMYGVFAFNSTIFTPVA